VTRSRGILGPRKKWSLQEDAVIQTEYPYVQTRKIAERLMVDEALVYRRAHALGLRKSTEFLKTDSAGRFNKLSQAGKPYRFTKGQKVWNEGTKGLCGTHPNSRRTQFKKGAMSGAAQHNYVSIGSLRITRDGILEKKVTDDPSVYPAKRWRPVTRLVWEKANGPIPKGHVVRFKKGLHTTEESEVTIGKLECVSLAENMRRNSYHNYPQPIPRLIQLKGAIQRQINKRSQNEEQA
jgi:hypothetical protein